MQSAWNPNTKCNFSKIYKMKNNFMKAEINYEKDL